MTVLHHEPLTSCPLCKKIGPHRRQTLVGVICLDCEIKAGIAPSEFYGCGGCDQFMPWGFGTPCVGKCHRSFCPECAFDVLSECTSCGESICTGCRLREHGMDFCSVECVAERIGEKVVSA